MLEHIALRERNAFDFMCLYIEKVLKDSGIWDPFASFFDEQTDEQYDNLKARFSKFCIDNTPIGTEVEANRIFTTILNQLACNYHKKGTARGKMSKTIITLEGTARSLDPDFSISSVAQEFIKYYYINKLSVDKILLRAKDNTEEILFDIRSIPKQLKTILRNLENNNIKIQMEDIKFTSLERCITDLATKLSLSLVLASMVIGSSLIISSQNINRNIWIKMMAITGFSISFIIGILLIIKIFRSQYKK